MQKKLTIFETFKKQIELINENRKYVIYIFYLFEFVCGGLLPVLNVYLLRTIIDTLSQSDAFDLAMKEILILCGINIILGVVSTICKNLATAKFIELRLREFKRCVDLYQVIDYEHLENANFAYEAENAIAALSSNDMGFEGLYANLLEILPNIFATLIFASLLVYINPLLIIVFLLSFSLSLWADKKTMDYIAKKAPERNKESKKVRYFYNVLFDFRFGKDIRVYDMKEALTAKYDYHINSYIDVIKAIERRRFGFGFIALLGILLQDGLAYFLVGYSFSQGYLSLGELSFYIGIIIALSTALRTIANTMITMTKNLKYTQEYLTFLNRDDLISKTGTLKAFPNATPLEIVFEDVSFKYPGTERYILKNLNFKITKGEKLAIVGKNGAGKSTIIKLICGFFKPTSGKILVNGISIADYDLTEYQKMIAAVFQDVNLYAATIIENVIGNSDLEGDLIRGKDCLDKVGLGEKIATLPKQYEQPLLKVLEEDGVDFSGGEAQKLAIARALYKDANLVILDEPTSALDALAEATIYESFASLVAGKTAIYISHRLSSTKFCDHIALFTDDGLVEYGSHEELMQKQGIYYEMFVIQGKYYQEGGEKYAKA